MTDSKPQPPYVAIVVCATIVLLALVGGFVALVLYAPPGTDLVKLIGAIGTGAALVATQVLNYLKTRSVEQQTTKVAATVDELANGKMDAKIRAGVADVVKPELIDDNAHQQLTVDRARRDGTT